ncbi:CG14384 [Drosophila busckii]|uniref:CG14384 n=1 Tax=Drosophila busckii TaxID=30019 RepID=A0A0M5J0I6_DROBS|nr:uncharacterized protein LOC108595750 [Drosophila busckii]ALC42824.1 CG14384 [Drosophila busckii]
MSCICQYILNAAANAEPPPAAAEAEAASQNTSDNEESQEVKTEPQQRIDSSQAPVTDDAKIAVCVSELAGCRAENWLLKKKLQEYEITIENLEQMMTTIVDKQHHVLSEMHTLRKRNNELQTESNLQREYHSMERNALIKELHDVKLISQQRLTNAAADDSTELASSLANDECHCISCDSDATASDASGCSTPSSIINTPYTSDAETEDSDIESDADANDVDMQQNQYTPGTDSESN